MLKLRKRLARCSLMRVGTLLLRQMLKRSAKYVTQVKVACIPLASIISFSANEAGSNSSLAAGKLCLRLEVNRMKYKVTFSVTDIYPTVEIDAQDRDEAIKAYHDLWKQGELAPEIVKDAQWRIVSTMKKVNNSQK